MGIVYQVVGVCKAKEDSSVDISVKRRERRSTPIASLRSTFIWRTGAYEDDACLLAFGTPRTGLSYSLKIQRHARDIVLDARFVLLKVPLSERL
jgi:hypothetical protein